MRLHSFFGLSCCLLSAGVALAQSPEPPCACGQPKPSRFAPPRFFAPAMTSPIPVRSEPFVIDSASHFGAPIVVRSARIEPPADEIIRDLAPLQVSIPERLLNQLLTDERSEVDQVRDVIANANVIGRQTTATRVVVDLRPSTGFAEMHLVLTGSVRSDTVGMTSQASVNTLGRHDVLAVKPVMFDGNQITTRRPRVWVDVHNEHVGAQTAYDGTLFGGFARSVAISTAKRQRTQVDAETAEHLAAQLGPKFNREADQQLARFNREWRDSVKARFGNLWPQQLTARSTDSQLLISAAWADAPALTQSDVTRAADADSVTFRVHESVLNSGLRTLNLGGKTVTETELREILESYVTKLGGRVLPRGNKLAGQPLPGTAPLIRLGEKDPVRISIVEGELRLTVVASIEVAGHTVLAQDEITVPMSSKFERGECRLTPGQLAFAKADNGVSLAGMVETLVRNQLASAFPDVVLPDSIPLPASMPSQPMASMRLARADASAGWLTLSLTFGAMAQPIPEPQPEEAGPFEIVPPRLIAPPRLESRRDPRGWFD